MSKEQRVPIKYNSPKNALRIQFSVINSAFFLMWNDQVLGTYSEAKEAIAEYERLQGEPAWVEVRGHYPEDAADITSRIKNLLGGYFHEHFGAKIETHSRGNRNEQIIKVHFFKSMPTAEAGKILGDIETIITQGFAPAGGISISMEIP